MVVRQFIRTIGRRFHLVLLLYFIVVILVMLMYLSAGIESDKPLNNGLRMEANRRALMYDEPVDDFTPVLISTHMRSGSTLLGDILQQDPEMFYVFEPLHDIQALYFRRMEAQDPTVQIRGQPPGSMYFEMALPLLRAWFSCNFSYITAKQSRTHVSFFKYGKKTSSFLDCVHRKDNPGRSKDEVLADCVEALQNECAFSEFRMIKTIRIEVDRIYNLFREFRRMKLIYLLRDPRATLASQMKFGECDTKHGGFEGCSRSLCSSIERDVEGYRSLLQRYQSQVMLLKYEELAMDPIGTSQKLYDFLGINLTPSIQDYIKGLTLEGNIPLDSMSIVRANSREHIKKWRTILNSNQKELIETNCRYILREFDYSLM